MNASKLTSYYFFVAPATYNTKHVISFSKFIHIMYKNSFPTAQTINRNFTTITCYTVLREIIVVCSAVNKKKVTKLCETKEAIMSIKSSTTCVNHCWTTCLIVNLNLFMSLHDAAKRYSIITCIRCYEKYIACFRRSSLQVYCIFKT